MKGRKKGRRVGSRWRHRGCLHDEEMEGSEQRGESLDHLFMRPEMIAEVCAVEGALSVYVAFGRWIKTVRQWGRDLGLRPRLENMPQRWPRCYFLTSNLFVSVCLSIGFSAKFSALSHFSSSLFFLLTAREGDVAERIE